MATVKLKFRASSVLGKEGTLYYHLIYQRNLRWMSTDYHVFPDEWNDKKSAIIVSSRNNRQAHLQLIQSQIDWEMKQMQRIIHDKEMDGIPYTIDDIAKEIQQLPPNKSVFTFFRQQIAKKEQMQCIGTKSNYVSAANRFMEFRDNEDLTFSQMTSEMMEMYQAWLFNRGVGKTPCPSICEPCAHSTTRLWKQVMRQPTISFLTCRPLTQELPNEPSL